MSMSWCKRGCESPVGRWITREDEDLAIGDMSSRHLVKAVSFIWRYGGVLSDVERCKLDELEAELKRRGDR